jgi:hypothetical protein
MENAIKISGNINPVKTISGNIEVAKTIYKNNYNDLKNKPSINGVLLKGNNTLEDLQITADCIPNLADVAKSGDYNDLSNKPIIPEIDVNKEYVDNNLNNKVDKIENMRLSENNYTNAEKEKLASLENYDDTTLKADIKKWEYTSVFTNSNIKSCNNAIETGNYRLFSSASNKPNNLKFGDMRVLNSDNMIIQRVFFIDGDNASKIAMRNSIDSGVNWSSWSIF